MNSALTAKAGSLIIGGSAPVSVQTMYDSAIKDADPALVVKKINHLAAMGCDMIRFSYVTSSDRPVFSYVASRSPIPVVADIHFDWRMAMEALDAGAHKIRINPGNIGEMWKTKEIVKAAMDRGAAIRIGLNTGSLPRHGKDVDEAVFMADTAMEYIAAINGWGFDNIVVSLKSSSVEKTLAAAEYFAFRDPHPVHLGVTEAGSAITSAVRSTWAIGNLLSKGIGDTVRVSINGSMEDEIITANEILRTLGLRKRGVRIVACPRCGRHSFDSHSFLSRIEPVLNTMDRDVTVAVMGCSVNGPGEAHGADYAVTGNGRRIFLYDHGTVSAVVNSAEEAENKLLEMISNG